MSRYTHSNWVPLTKEDDRVHGSGKVYSWKTRTKPMGAVAKSIYKQKRDKRGSMVAGVYTLVCRGERGNVSSNVLLLDFTCLLKPCFSSRTKVLYNVHGRPTKVPYTEVSSKNAKDWTI